MKSQNNNLEPSNFFNRLKLIVYNLFHKSLKEYSRLKFIFVCFKTSFINFSLYDVFKQPHDLVCPSVVKAVAYTTV